jgi:5-(carboxyamino)imidazole ribonucleotide synthase
MAILPGSTLGMLGGGQLGRMFVTAARTMGYEVIVLDPDPNSPAGGLASQHLASDYDDTEALDYLSRHCAAVTTEFENIPAVTLAYLAKSVPVHPSASALHIAQHRKQEKEFFREQGLSTADFVAIENDDDVESARDFSFPAILKTAMLGYDGKGQVVCLSFDELQSAFEQIGRKHCVLEQRIDLDCEVSVVLCRSLAGEVTCFPIAENSHANGILDVSIAPAVISPELAAEARDAATRIANGLDYCGVLASFSYPPTSACWSTRWRRDPTIRVTIRWMPAKPLSSSSRCAWSAICRQAPAASIARSRCGTCWAISGPTAASPGGMRC